MKSLGKTIDRILKVDPELAPDLGPLKAKWQRYPSRTQGYWKELLLLLNSGSLQEHPRRDEIKSIVTETKKHPRQTYTFTEAAPNDHVIGVIPEHIADVVRRYDRAAIKLAKAQVVANMTRDIGLLAELSRNETLLEIGMRKMWLMLKDHFKLWDKPMSFTIKKGGPVLVLVENPPNPQQGMIFPMRMDPNTLRQFLGMMGMGLPPDME